MAPLGLLNSEHMDMVLLWVYSVYSDILLRELQYMSAKCSLGHFLCLSLSSPRHPVRNVQCALLVTGKMLLRASFIFDRPGQGV